MTSLSHWSHVEKIASIAVELANLGYPITFLTGRVYEDHISNLHPNIKFSAFLGLDDKLSDEDTKKMLSMPPGPDRDLWLTKELMYEPIPAIHETLQIQFREFRQKYGNTKPLIVVYDQTVTGHLPVILGAPGLHADSNIGIGASPLLMDSNFTFPINSGKMPHTGPDFRSVHQAAYKAHYEGEKVKAVNEAFWDKLREMGVVQDRLPGLYQSFNMVPEHLLTLGIPEFEFPRPDIRPNVYYYGALKKVMKQMDKNALLPPWWDDIAKAKKEGKKTIAVSQGTIEMDPTEITIPTIEALKDRTDVLVIASFVAVDPSEIPGLVVPGNTRVAKFVPYDTLLPLVDLLITNGGYGAVQQALRLGVPMIVSGEGQDKPTVCAIVQWSGVGIGLGVRRPGSEKIRASVEQILGDESYAKKVKSLSMKFEQYDVAKVFDGVIQGVVHDWKLKSGKKEAEL